MATTRSNETVGYAVAVVTEDGKWTVTPLDNNSLTDLAIAEKNIRDLRSTGAVFGLLNVDDEFFIVVRPAPSGARLLLSDATAAVDYDIAAQVLDEINVEVPDFDDDELAAMEPWEEGDAGLLADLGLPEPVLAVIVGDSSLYADEQIAMVAARMGFDDELATVLETLDR